MNRDNKIRAIINRHGWPIFNRVEQAIFNLKIAHEYYEKYWENPRGADSKLYAGEAYAYLSQAYTKTPPPHTIMIVKQNKIDYTYTLMRHSIEDLVQYEMQILKTIAQHLKMADFEREKYTAAAFGSYKLTNEDAYSEHDKSVYSPTTHANLAWDEIITAYEMLTGLRHKKILEHLKENLSNAVKITCEVNRVEIDE